MEIQTFSKLSTFKEITNNSIKDSIINMIYENLNVSNFRYQLLDDNKSFESIKKEQLYITPHIMGVNCWLIFCEIDGKRYQCFINKKDLKFYQNQMNPNNYKLYNFWFDHINNKELYPLTIFDGKFINNGTDPNNLTYLISDIYVKGGVKMLTSKLIDKIYDIETLLPKINNGLDQKFIIRGSSIYNMDQLGDLIFNKIKNSKLKINGLIFMPERSGKTYIYINDTEFIQLRSTSYNNFKEYVSLSIPAIPISMQCIPNQTDNQLVNEFVLRKTNISDVYEIYEYSNKDKIYLNLTKEQKVGIAHISDIKTSHYCKKMGDDLEIFINKCVYNNKFKKWMPIVN